MANTSELLKILDRVGGAHVLVVGDVMLDRYWLGDALRLSPEAPVPVVTLKTVSNVPGGAANVAANIAGLGAKVTLVGVVGKDDAAASLKEALVENGIAPEFLVLSDTRSTTAKTRVLVHNQQIARVDEETADPISEANEAEVLRSVSEALSDVDVVLLSDYAKGCLTDRLTAAVIGLARKAGKKIIVDPKSRDLTKYNGATLLTPNLAEILSAAGIEGRSEEFADEAAAKVLATGSFDSLLVTLGEHGMKLFEREREPAHFPSMARQVFDVTGAGDTVIAFVGAALGAGANFHAAIAFANIGAGISVEKVGTAIVGVDELRAAIEGHSPHIENEN